MEKLDVVIVGGGLSGIGAACHLATHCPEKSYAVLEARGAIGGTWDLFRYPGVRSDSDMYTLGYVFKPWVGDKALADGDSIRDYILQAAQDYQIDQHVRLGHKAIAASWDSDQSLWTLTITCGDSGDTQQMQCGFLYLCTGYYDYETPHDPVFTGSEAFAGQIIHPQRWPEHLDYSDKRVVVIGSGATAVTLVPAMAREAAHVTMLQRSPTYIMSTPSVDKLSRNLRRLLPERAVFQTVRWKNILLGMLVYQLCQRRPEWAKSLIMRGVKSYMGTNPEVLDNFTPRYKPWDQRLCLIPDGDFFEALTAGDASIVTDHIERFTEQGVLLSSGTEIPADLVVTATGLKLKMLDNLSITVDGKAVALPDRMIYRGMMISDVPNMAFTIGYTNASWTLKADLVAGFVVRLLQFMDEGGYTQCCPQAPEGSVAMAPLMNFTSGYIQRAMDELPNEGIAAPWKMHQNYILDKFQLTRGAMADGVMRFG